MTLKDSIQKAYRDERKAIKNNREWTAERIRSMRTRLNYTQAEFALLLGTRQNKINEWEHGHTTPRNHVYLFRLQICEERYLLPLLLEEQRMAQVKAMIDLDKDDEAEFQN